MKKQFTVMYGSLASESQPSVERLTFKKKLKKKIQLEFFL